MFSSPVCLLLKHYSFRRCGFEYRPAYKWDSQVLPAAGKVLFLGFDFYPSLLNDLLNRSEIHVLLNSHKTYTHIPFTFCVLKNNIIDQSS